MTGSCLDIRRTVMKSGSRPERRLERRILKDWDPQPVTAKEKEITLEILKKNPISGQRNIDFAKFPSPYLHVSADDKRRIIIHVSSGISKTPSDKTESLFDIFDGEGHYLARISFLYKSFTETPLWNAGKLYTVSRTKTAIHILSDIPWNSSFKDRIFIFPRHRKFPPFDSESPPSLNINFVRSQASNEARFDLSSPLLLAAGVLKLYLDLFITRPAPLPRFHRDDLPEMS